MVETSSDIERSYVVSYWLWKSALLYIRSTDGRFDMSKKELIELADKLQELYLVAEGDSEVLWKDWQEDETDIRKRIYYEKTSGTAMGLVEAYRHTMAFIREKYPD